MSLIINGTTIPTNADSVRVNNVLIDEIIANGISVWKKAKNYYVQFNANGGSGTMTNQTFTLGVAQALKANTFTRTATGMTYTFLGWSTSSTAATATYTNGQSVTNLTTAAEATITLYAVWKVATFEVFNGGTRNNITWSGYDSLGSAIYRKTYAGTSSADVWTYGNVYSGGINFTNLNTMTVTLTYQSAVQYNSSIFAYLYIGSSQGASDAGSQVITAEDTWYTNVDKTLTFNVSALTGTKYLTLYLGAKNRSTGNITFIEVYIKSIILSA